MEENTIMISEDESNDGIDECQRDITKSFDGGVLKSVLQGGRFKSKPKYGDEILLHMIGQLKEGGKVFFNSRKNEKPIRSVVGSNDLPDALNILLPTMKINEIAMITVKPEYAYGNEEKQVGPDFEIVVPANSSIIFEVELLDFCFNDCTDRKNKGVIRLKTIQEGDGTEYPTYNSEVNCNIKGYFYLLEQESNLEDFIIELEGKLDNKSLFFDKNVSWFIGEGILNELPKGVEIAVKAMLTNEISIFQIKKNYFFNKQKTIGYDNFNPDSNLIFVYEIKLNWCKKAKEYYELDGDQRFKESLECKIKGNYYLTEQLNVELALKRFKRAIDLLETSIDLDKQNEERDNLLFTCYLNITKAYFLANTPESALEYINKALKMKPNDEKALYRYAIYLMKRKMYSEAENQFFKLLNKYPENQIAKTNLTICKNLLYQQLKQQKQLYKSMIKEFL